MKAKLVIDMPSNCENCRLLCYREDYSYPACCATGKDLEHDDEDEIIKPDWCPLEPVKELKSAYTIDFCIPKPYPRGLRENITKQLFYDLGMQLVNHLEVEEKKIPIVPDRVCAIDCDKSDMNMSDYHYTEFSVTLHL